MVQICCYLDTFTEPGCTLCSFGVANHIRIICDGLNKRCSRYRQRIIKPSDIQLYFDF